MVTTTTRARRPHPERPAFVDECDHIIAYCFKAYITGPICGRSLLFRYRTFVRYCDMDWLNCKLRYETWQIVHMGECYKYTLRKGYKFDFVIFLAAESKANQFKWSIDKDLPARRQNQLDLLPPPAEHTGKPGKTTRQHLERPFKVENCDNIAYYCFKAYNTGRVCARSDSLYVNKDDYEPRYQTMDNYCMMDYINCSEGFDVWKVAHLGACMADKTYYFNRLGEYYEYFDDIFLDNTYVIME